MAIRLKDLKSVTKIVKEILQNNPSLRNDDDLLYRKVCFYCMPQVVHLSFSEVLINRRVLGLPSFETVRRSRQKVQELYPELRATERVRGSRKAKETEYRKFARGEV